MSAYYILSIRYMHSKFWKKIKMTIRTGIINYSHWILTSWANKNIKRAIAYAHLSRTTLYILQYKQYTQKCLQRTFRTIKQHYTYFNIFLSSFSSFSKILYQTIIMFAISVNNPSYVTPRESARYNCDLFTFCRSIVASSKTKFV